jgi:hypothetical protein
MMNEFNISDDTMVVTSSYVTREGRPILEVSHEDDEEGGSLWQFHCGNGDYSMERMELVRLDTILEMDPTVREVANLDMGQCARRSAINARWVVERARGDTTGS